jgi:hypothetical protein
MPEKGKKQVKKYKLCNLTIKYNYNMGIYFSHQSLFKYNGMMTLFLFFPLEVLVKNLEDLIILV